MKICLRPPQRLERLGRVSFSFSRVSQTIFFFEVIDFGIPSRLLLGSSWSLGLVLKK